MDPKKLTRWSIWSGFIGVILYIIAAVMLWQGSDQLLFDKFDHKDLYFAGSGLLYIAIWLKLGAIYHKGGQ
ncbi:MAG: hypothetical protein HY396_00210 [Candidatus Doudnabacteria bacterium]|nr:hypothetical protein [Candidatus Doudnabacteria bacterium]